VSRYPETSAEIYDSFGTKSGPRRIGSTSQSLTNFHLFNVLTRDGEWTARLNGILKYTTIANVVGFSAAPKLGNSGNAYLAGDIAEVLIYNRALTAAERKGVNLYLNQKYKFIALPPQVPTNLTLNVLSPQQISVWWNTGTNNEQTTYRVERGTDGSNFTQIAEIEGASFIDSGLTANVHYYYRVQANNLAGSSLYSAATNATTSSSGTNMPLASNTLKLWLKADAGAPVNYDGTLNAWLDLSGNTNTITYHNNSSDYIDRPYWFSTTNANNHPVIRFYGSNWFDITFTTSPTNWSGGEGFLVLKAKTNSIVASAPGQWRLGGPFATAVYYPRPDKAIADSFGNEFSRTITNVWEAIPFYHLYNVSSAAGGWNAWLNGSSIFSTTNNTVNFGIVTPTIGRGANPFDGDMLELFLFNRALDSTERDVVNNYLRQKYNLW
jgi:hypothetical protein